MNVTRLPIAVVCIALMGAATHAEAKPKLPAPAPPCRALLTDPPGDANGINVGSPVPAMNAGPTVDALDIIAVDLGTGRRGMVWALRVKKLALTSPTAPTGMFWSLHFTIRKTAYAVTARAGAGGAVTYDASYRSNSGGGSAGALSGVVDQGKSEFRITVPWSAVAQQEAEPSRATIKHIDAVTGQQFAAPDVPTGVAGTHAGAYNAVDWTTDDATYTPGKRPRCG